MPRLTHFDTTHLPLFTADAFILWNILQYLPEREYALVSYQTLYHVDPRKYDRVSIFAAHAAGTLSDPNIRYIHGLTVDPRKVSRATMASHYREWAYEEYLARRIYHEAMVDRLSREKRDIRVFYPRGIPYTRRDIISRCSLSVVIEYVRIIDIPLSILPDIVERMDAAIDSRQDNPSGRQATTSGRQDNSLARWNNLIAMHYDPIGRRDDADAEALCEWFIRTYALRTKTIRPRRIASLRLFEGHAIIDYSCLVASDITRANFPLTSSCVDERCGTKTKTKMVTNPAFANLVLRDDADSLPLQWPHGDRDTIRGATLKGHASIIRHILTQPNHERRFIALKHALEVAYISPRRSGDAILAAVVEMYGHDDARRVIPSGATMSCMAIYEYRGKPSGTSLGAMSYGISRDVYVEYRRGGGDGFHAAYYDEHLIHGEELLGHISSPSASVIRAAIISIMVMDGMDARTKRDVIHRTPLTAADVEYIRKKMKDTCPDKPCLI